MIYHNLPAGNPCVAYGNNLCVEAHPGHLDGCESSCYFIPSSGRKRVRELQYGESSFHPSYEHCSSKGNIQAIQGNEIGMIPDHLPQHEYPKPHDNLWNGGYNNKRRFHFIDFFSGSTTKQKKVQN
ncbi:hypothetical protein PCANC_01821 [Puccinia coronata f. sp. avenae]|uniref:Uncharacterized protein n=1 Tax=Puccinia coronata f. sp. avenae TaxID=200324 RepID=A0A2N5T8W6_9BASI|nr:hypothetical protein PCANC_03346 [Puccinia coronata f. sp. avenae]PLW57370.1 hypothetical protein PCANC_01821 [Puccinia coronata f. sp. avenae]